MTKTSRLAAFAALIAAAGLGVSACKFDRNKVGEPASATAEPAASAAPETAAAPPSDAAPASSAAPVAGGEAKK